MTIIVILWIAAMLLILRAVGGNSSKYFIRQQQELSITNGYIEEMIEDAKNKSTGGGYTVTKSGYTAKPKKSKGEILYIEYKVTIEKTFE